MLPGPYWSWLRNGSKRQVIFRGTGLPGSPGARKAAGDRFRATPNATRKTATGQAARAAYSLEGGGGQRTSGVTTQDTALHATPATMAGDSGLKRSAPTRSPCPRRRMARVMPQPGHHRPVTSRNQHREIRPRRRPLAAMTMPDAMVPAVTPPRRTVVCHRCRGRLSTSVARAALSLMVAITARSTAKRLAGRRKDSTSLAHWDSATTDAARTAALGATIPLRHPAYSNPFSRAALGGLPSGGRRWRTFARTTPRDGF